MKHLLVLLVLCAGLSACTGDEPPQKIDLSRRETVEVKDPDDAITYAYLPQYSHSISYHRHNLLVEYLKKETGYPIKQIFPTTFDEHIRMVGQGKVDISFTNPYVYVKTASRYGEKAFAQVIEDSGQKSFRGQIICRADNSSIQTIHDCKGKRLIAVDLTSAGGYLYPMGHFFDHGIRQEDFAEVDFSHGPGGKQEKVILAVYAGQYDIGLIREGALNVVADRIDIRQIRVIAHSKYYPGWVYSARKDLEQEVLQRIQKALFKLSWDDPDHRKILEKADFIRVVPSHDTEFELIRELLTVVGIDLEK